MENLTLQLEIATPERVLFKVPVRQVSVPTAAGEITILPHHVPLVSIINAGVLEFIKPDGESEVLAVVGGFVEVLSGKVVVLADTAELASEIHETQIAAARARATEPSEHVHSDEMVVVLERELARGRALSKWRRVRGLDN